jgi:hypothetical protein
MVEIPAQTIGHVNSLNARALIVVNSKERDAGGIAGPMGMIDGSSRAVAVLLVGVAYFERS